MYMNAKMWIGLFISYVYSPIEQLPDSTMGYPVLGINHVLLNVHLLKC